MGLLKWIKHCNGPTNDGNKYLAVDDATELLRSSIYIKLRDK